MDKMAQPIAHHGVVESKVTQACLRREDEPKKHSRLARFCIRLVTEKPLGTVGAIITLLLVLIGIFAEFLAPYGMNEIHRPYFLFPPSDRFWLGTDNLGRCILTRVIYGARVSMIVGVVGTALATVIAIVIGLVSGYIGGKLDLIGQRFVDTVMSLPALILLMVVISMIGPGLWPVALMLGVVWGIGGSRTIRSAVIAIKENEYVQAAITIGCSTPTILTRHILPNIMAPLIIQSTIWVPAIILTEAALSFLGFGIPPLIPSWGGMLSGAGRDFMFRAPWMAIWPGLALSITVYGINMFGDAVRDLLDPRLRGGAGHYGINKPKEVSIKK